MNTTTKSASKKITAYQVFGWTPLFVTVVGASVVVALSIIRDL